MLYPSKYKTYKFKSLIIISSIQVLFKVSIWNKTAVESTMTIDNWTNYYVSLIGLLEFDKTVLLGIWFLC